MLEKLLGEWNTLYSAEATATISSFFKSHEEDALIQIQENTKTHRRRAIVKTVNGIQNDVDYDFAVLAFKKLGIEIS